MRDFRRDLRRALPGGAAYDGDVFLIEFAGDLINAEANDPGFAAHRSRYYVTEEDEAEAAVRELITDGGIASRRVYGGVESFSVEESADYESVFEVRVGLGHMKSPVRESIRAPAAAGELR